MEKIRFTKEHRYFKKSYNKIMDMKYYNIKINENEILWSSYLYIWVEFDWDDEIEHIFRGLIRKISYYFRLQNRFIFIVWQIYRDRKGSHAKTLYRILKAMEIYR